MPEVMDRLFHVSVLFQIWSEKKIKIQRLSEKFFLIFSISCQVELPGFVRFFFIYAPVFVQG